MSAKEDGPARRSTTWPIDAAPATCLTARRGEAAKEAACPRPWKWPSSTRWVSSPGRGWSTFGWCTDCALRYRWDLPPGQTVPSGFSIDLRQLIAERGAGTKIVGMKPPRCHQCDSASTRLIVETPERDWRGNVAVS